MTKKTFLTLIAFLLIGPVLLLADDGPKDNIGHTRHTLKHGGPMKTEPVTPERFTTTRSSEVKLALPVDEESFSFIIFGDRTSGKPEGVSILADAVYETNLIEPDFVINVGDMIQGYNTTDLWLEQMTEYKGIMQELKCPWFPVPGNHDVYWRGDNRPLREHEEDYEKHFGPLWYAFEHKNCWFIVLFTDEGNLKTTQKSFREPESQIMSDAQFNWLKATLEKAKGADHVFVFQHQPRWYGGNNYGKDWDRVHNLFVEAGNVSMVFAGHVHRMGYDKKDGIEYVVLATTGGNLNENVVPAGGFIHHFNQVTVRKDRLGIITIPVWSGFDPRSMTRKNQTEIVKLCTAKYTATLLEDGKKVEFPIHNSSSAKVDVVATLGDHRIDETLEPGQKTTFTFVTSPSDKPFHVEQLVTLEMTYHGGVRPEKLPEKQAKILVPAPAN